MWLADWLTRGARSPFHAAYLRHMRLRRLAVHGAQIALLVAILGLWELAADRQWVNPFLTSQPSRIWAMLLQMGRDGTLWLHTGVTLQETLIGFVAGAVLGVGMAALLWRYEFLHRVLDPYLVVLNSLPKIALGPIFFVWLGDVLSVYGMALAISWVVTVIMVHAGFDEVDPDLIKLVRAVGASRLQVFTKVVLPASVPTMLASFKVNVGLTLVGVIVGEFLSSKAGLGYLIIYGGQVFKLDLVMASVTVLAIISALLYLALQGMESWVTRRVRC